MKKKYFGLLGLLLVVILLSSCSVQVGSGIEKPTEEPLELKPIEVVESFNVKKLSHNQETSTEYQNTKLTDAQKGILQNFANLWPSALFNGEKNEIFSPISLYFALAMLDAGASDTEIIAELNSLMGASVDKVLPLMSTVYNNNHYNNEKGRCYLANSIWVRPELEIEEEYYEALSQYFNAESYLANFASREAKSKIVDWINYYTEDLLQLTPENYDIDDSLAVMLLNTIYFNNTWLTEFEKPYERTFYGLKENVQTKFMYHKVHTSYKITSSYTAVSDSFANGNKIYYFMPKETNFEELFSMSFAELIKGMSYSDVKLTVPLFETMAEYDLVAPLKEMGYEKIFSGCNGYQGITQNIYVDIIKQNAGIKLTEKGVEAAAVTQIGTKVTSAGIDLPEIVITLDHPFYYIIVDANNVPLFMGVTTNPKK